MNDEIQSMEPEVTMTDADIHEELKARGVKLHHKTGSEKLQATLEAVLAGTYEAPIVEAKEAPTAPVEAAPVATPANVKVLTEAEHLQKLTKEQRALRMQRIVVTPNDPLMSAYNGLIFTVGSSSVNKGRMIKKYVPFNNDDGWHVPQIIIDQIDAAQMQKFRTVTMPDGTKTMQPYITKKFNVQILPPLNTKEMAALGASQQSRGNI